MSNFEIDELGPKLIGKAYRGCYPRDEIPELKNGEGCVVNTDPSGEKGTHWTALYRDDSGKLWGFDSYGRDINKLLHIKGAKNVDDDRNQEFYPDTSCGAQCLSWLTLCHHLGIEVAKMV